MSDKQQLTDFSTILASSVHDMKNSVGMLIGSLDNVASSCGGSCPSHAQLTRLRYEGERLNRNLVQVLALYRISDAQYSLNLTENDVGEVLEECYLEYEPLMSVNGIEMEIVCDEELNGFFDRELILGVISSVINNAYKYASNRIRLGAEQKEGYLVLYVEDNGPGYPPEMLHECGDLQHGVSFKKGSTGLGMFFASTILRMHRHRDRAGYLSMTNEGIEGGARFSIYLP